MFLLAIAETDDGEQKHLTQQGIKKKKKVGQNGQTVKIKKKKKMVTSAASVPAKMQLSTIVAVASVDPETDGGKSWPHLFLGHVVLISYTSHM